MQISLYLPRLGEMVIAQQIVALIMDSRLRGNKFLHPVCHSREGGNPEDLQSKVSPQRIEK
jgi:hypothetical protein